MMPWRAQLALIWAAARYVIWPPDVPLWGQAVYKAGQVTACFAWAEAAWWLWGAGCALCLAVSLVCYAPWRQP